MVDEIRLSFTCERRGKNLVSNVSGAVPEPRDNGLDGISRYTINHSDIGTLTKHGQLKMAASATQSQSREGQNVVKSSTQTADVCNSSPAKSSSVVDRMEASKCDSDKPKNGIFPGFMNRTFVLL
uniref:Glutamate receptor, ionotropic, kainate 3 n=1 Tax=Nothobranchius pienaari TaxID=704102 RepID=A0A1A8N7U8_9TELE